jgi:hypothetical protein
MTAAPKDPFFERVKSQSRDLIKLNERLPQIRSEIYLATTHAAHQMHAQQIKAAPFYERQRYR